MAAGQTITAELHFIYAPTPMPFLGKDFWVGWNKKLKAKVAAMPSKKFYQGGSNTPGEPALPYDMNKNRLEAIFKTAVINYEEQEAVVARFPYQSGSGTGATQPTGASWGSFGLGIILPHGVMGVNHFLYYHGVSDIVYERVQLNVDDPTEGYWRGPGTTVRIDLGAIGFYYQNQGAIPSTTSINFIGDWDAWFNPPKPVVTSLPGGSAQVHAGSNYNFIPSPGEPYDPNYTTPPHTYGEEWVANCGFIQYAKD